MAKIILIFCYEAAIHYQKCCALFTSQVVILRPGLAQNHYKKISSPPSRFWEGGWGDGFLLKSIHPVNRYIFNIELMGTI